ncbi:MAG: hypothetical protein IIX85_09880 [Clostridia bacterium]|nr:hypothetical protein [Clostridia bacterium]
MNRKLTVLVVMLIVGALLFGFSVSASAGTVTYDGDSKKFVFSPGSKHSPTDLFSEFKDLMPGDSVKQDVTVKNAASNDVKIKLYVRSKGADEASKEFLSKLQLNVAKAENNEMAYMFDASADQTAGMTDWVLLGTLYSGGEVNLVLNLQIPIDLNDSFQNAIGKIDWEFKVEEFPIEPDDPKPPQTDDDNTMYLFAIPAIISVLCLIPVILKKRRRSDDDDEE